MFRFKKPYPIVIAMLLLVLALGSPFSVYAAQKYVEPGFAHDMSGNLTAINNGTFEGVTARLDVGETYSYMLMTHGLIEFFKCQESADSTCQEAKTYDHNNLKVKYTQNAKFIDISFSKGIYGEWGVDCIYLNISFTDAGKKSKENSAVKGVLYYEKTVDGVVHRTNDIPFQFILTGQSKIVETTSSKTNEPTQSAVSSTVTESSSTATSSTNSEPAQSVVSSTTSETKNSTSSAITQVSQQTGSIKEGYDIIHDVQEYVDALAQGKNPDPIRRKLYINKKYGMQPLMRQDLIATIPCRVDRSDCSVTKGCTKDDIKFRLTENADLITLSFGEDASGNITMEVVPSDGIKQKDLPKSVTGYIYFEKEGGGMVHQTERIYFEFELQKSLSYVFLIVGIIAGVVILAAVVSIIVIVLKRKKASGPAVS